MQQQSSRSGLARLSSDKWSHCAIRAGKPFNSTITATSGQQVMRRWKLTPLLLGSMLFTSTQAFALTTVTVKVTVLAEPSCVINGGNPIEVTFSDDAITTRVDGHHYMEVIPANVECKGLASNSLKLKVQGTPAYFGLNILATEQQDLGIALLSDGNPLILNNNIKFSYPYIPVLNAVPVKAPGSTLNPGKFSAAATLTLEYQ
ncbi:fimbrial protein [Yersinia kristensenii]|uniref:fimbrial protein n=1 Tax=Yersinia kristensenii TaxID=28152 RepID=UPI0005E5F662|nr:fimbrial protein [Yersinia kristensenii]CNE49354.1 exported pilin protein [Yersinia kristensenii]